MARLSDSFMTREATFPTVDAVTTPTLNVVSIVVADMPAALAFYRACGLVIDPAQDGEPHASAEPVGGFTVMFDTHDVMRSMDPSWTPGSGGHRMALAFDCATPSGVNELHATLTSAGHESHLEPFDAFWGQRYAVVLDPDGNPVDLYAAL
jgi:catechol 2,3-dioxygenase-like lactoylglutathione lyase family enzyme